MITISIVIEAKLNVKVDEKTLSLDKETEDKMESLMKDVENTLIASGLEEIDLNYDFLDEDEDLDFNGDDDIRVTSSENLSIHKNDDVWSTGTLRDDVVEEDGKQYKKEQ